jgi:signal transduction histidine kinase
MEIVMFYWPVYRVAGLIKAVTAAVSWGTVLALIPVVPRALAMRSPEALQREIDERERAEAEIRRLNEELEDRVRERTAELEAANRIKDQLLKSEARAREEAEQSRESAEMANRAKDEFLMTLSHELRTPLNAIQGWVTLLRGGRLDAEMAERAMETIERNTWTQTRLVSDILEVSRIITGKLVLDLGPVEMRPVVESTLEAILPAAEAKGVLIQTSWNMERALVSGDAERLQQVTWNLLSNAVKFTPRGGHINITLQAAGSHVELVVEDTGEGIEPEFLPHVFDRFRQADSSSIRKHGGLGLGLAIVRHLVELHGGAVHAASAGPGLGSTFKVSLPLRAISGIVPRRGSWEDADGAPNLKSIRVLVVDDDPEARTLVSTILDLEGAQTQIAGSVPEALEVVGHWSPELIVSDLGMPGQDGYELIRLVRLHEDRHVPAIALSAYASQWDKEQAISAGYDAHISKPVSPEMLLAEVIKVTGSKE